VNVSDRPGGIATLAKVMAEAGVSVKVALIGSHLNHFTENLLYRIFITRELGLKSE
jgi:hypothetical protein